MNNKHQGMFFEMDYGKDIKIDLKDKKILAVLGENCRTQISHMAKMVGLGKDSIRYRIKELIKKDIYRSNLAILNPFVFGISINALLLKLEKITPEKEEEIIAFFENHPFVVWAGHTQGAYDFNIIILALDLKHFDKLLREIRAKLMGNLKDLKVLYATKMYSCNTFPMILRKEVGIEIKYEKLDSSFGSLLKKVPYCSSDEEKINLDKVDFLIISTIANNANMTLQEISKSTGIKPDTVKNRIINLIKKNAILAFRASINISYLKFHGHIAYFRLYPNITEEQRSKFENYFKHQDFTSFGSEVANSDYDFMIYIFAKDPLDFNRIINEIRSNFSNIIEDYETVLILMDYKFTFLPEGIISPMKKLLLKMLVKF
jgi:DNA-binding Lrp family transcriptional regulator